MRFWFGVFVGALLMALYAYRQTIRDIVENRKAISAGAETAEGIGKAISGAKKLWAELD